MEAIQKATGDPGADLRPLVPELIARLDGGDEWSVEEAAKTLGIIGDASAVEALCQKLRAPPVSLPEELGPKSGDMVLAAAMVASDEDGVRGAAIKALEAIGEPAAIPALQACAQDPRQADHVRKAAKDAVKALSEAG